MIKYCLSCSGGHEFESWFRAIGDYDTQWESGLIVCPICGSKEITKQPMAPAVLTGRDSARLPQPSAGSESDSAEAAVLGTLRALKKSVIENSEDVGSRFADEARKIHFGEAEERRIRGNSTPEEAKEMLEEGVPFGILPLLPEDLN
jgi:hypothetical protein